MVPAEIQLASCGYAARCSVRQCHVRATTVARYTDDQGRPLRQRELCDRHAEWLRANRSKIHEERDAHESSNETCPVRGAGPRGGVGDS
jgi:hypothetical protein